MTPPTIPNIVAEIRARIAVLQREARCADDDENITAKSCQHSAQELTRLLTWIEGTNEQG